MKTKLFALLILISLSMTNLMGQKLTNNMDTLSYSFGVLIAKNLKNQGVEEISIEALSKAFKDVYSGDTLDIDPTQANKVVNDFMQAQQTKAYEGIIAEGKEFLSANGKREEVTTTASGLQYEVLEEGTGEVKPTKTNKVTVHYKGTLINGKEFDSSYKRGEPISFDVTGVIKGWTEALQLMTVGAKYRLFIPENLAYGSRGAGRDIPPYSTLIFEVELLEIN